MGRRPRNDRLSAYQLRVNVAEVDELLIARQRDADALADALKRIGVASPAALHDGPDLPDVLPFLMRSWPKVLLTRVQEFVWTARHLRAWFSARAPAKREIARPPQGHAGAPIAAGGPTLYVDITATHRAQAPGGIKRVCLRIAAELQGSAIACPVALADGILRRLGSDGETGDVVTLTARDTYLILDYFWDPYDDYMAALRDARRNGARTALCLYDVIPILYPGLLTREWADQFDQQLRSMLPLVDVIVSISRSSAKDIKRVVRRYGMRHEVVWFHLGSDTFGTKAVATPSSHGTPQFISVGALEPKKGYDCALDAFDLVWNAGIDARYVVVGRRGWLCGALVRRIESHAEFGTRLVWLDNASDTAVQTALADSYCSIQASVAEGFGLPIVEAAQAGLPVIASDLVVFREIAGDSLCYFPVCDSEALAKLIEEVIATRPPSPRIASLSWAQSATALLDALGMRAARP